MSSTYRMNVVWASHGAQLQRDLQQIYGQLGQVEQMGQRSGRQMSLWGQQMRAIGTTIRYALAGALIYSVARSVNALGDFEARLGEIDSLAARMSGGKLQGLGGDIGRVADIALDASNRIGMSVDQIQQNMISFYSAFEAPPGRRGIQQLQEFTKSMNDLMLISEGADPRALSQALAVMSRDVRTGQLRPGRAADITSVIANVLQTTPNIRGEDIARDLGRLSAARVAARMTPEEILGVYGQAAKAGGSASVIGRGVAQLLTTGVVRPRTKTEVTAFERAVGTADPTALRQLGGVEILRRMMMAVAPRGISRGRGRRVGALMGQEELTTDEAVSAAGDDLRGINLTLATQLFGRQESLRVFLNLLAEGGPRALQSYINSHKQAEKDLLGERRAELVNQRRWFQQLTTAQQNFGLSVMRGLEPALRPAAQGLTSVFRLGSRHPSESAGIIGGVAALGLLARFGAAGALARRLPGGLGRFARLRGLQSLGAPAALEVGGGLGGFTATGLPTGISGGAGAGSRGNPFWVVIDPMSWFLPGAPSGGIGGGVPGTGGGGGGLRGFLRRQVSRAGAAGTGIGGFLARRQLLRAARFGGVPVAAGLALAFPENADAEAIATGQVQPGDVGYFDPRRQPFISRIMRNAGRRHSRGTTMMLDRFSSGDISAGHFERWLRQMALRNARARGESVDIDGEAALKVTVELTPEVRKLLKVSAPQGLPVKLWSQGNPQHRGKNKKQRSNIPPGATGGVG